MKGDEKRCWRLFMIIVMLKWLKKHNPGAYVKLEGMMNLMRWIPVKIILYDKVYYKMLYWLTKMYMGEEMQGMVLDKDLIMREKVNELSRWSEKFRKNVERS